MRKQSRDKRTHTGQAGFTLIELMVAVVVLIVGVLGVAQLVPAALTLNFVNRANSNSMLFAQRLLDEFMDQPITTFAYTDATGTFPCNPCNLGTGNVFNAVEGSPLTTLAGHAAIDFTAATVAGYSFVYRDPEDTSGVWYDVRWAVISTGPAAGSVSSRRILLGVMKRDGDKPLPPVTLETLVEK